LSKTCFSVFSKRDSSGFKELIIKNTVIKKVECTKYLGLYVDENLQLLTHVDYICNKLIKLTNVFRKIASYIDKNMSVQLYYAYVYPLITYGIEAYGSLAKKDSNRLQILQNKLLKILCNRDYKSSSSGLHKELNLLNIQQISEFFTLCFVFKQLTNQLPGVFNDFYVLNSDMNERITRQSKHIHVLKYKTNWLKKSLKVQGAKCWNDLPNNVKGCNSLSSFKKACKAYILSK
jgi:hypothetical protein